MVEKGSQCKAHGKIWDGPTPVFQIDPIRVYLPPFCLFVCLFYLFIFDIDKIIATAKMGSYHVTSSPKVESRLKKVKNTKETGL